MYQKTKIMKTKIISLSACVLALNLLATSYALAQQPENSKPLNKVTNESKNGNYSYHILDFPDNSFGYDILNNGKPVFHQPSLKLITDVGKEIIARRDQVERSALLSIAKIKRGLPAALTNQEIRAITR
jgi:hypothetical protein